MKLLILSSLIIVFTLDSKACSLLNPIVSKMDVIARNIVNAEIDSSIDLTREEAKMETLKETYEYSVSVCANLLGAKI